MRPAKPKLQNRASVVQFVKEVKEDEHKVIKELFEVADTEKKGAITPKQLRGVMLDLGVNASDEEFQLLFEGMDLNNDGAISLSEFIAGVGWFRKSIELLGRADAPAASPSTSVATAQRPAAPPPAAGADTKSRSPLLTRSKSIVELAKQVSEDDLRAAQELFGLVDVNHDGSITQDELAKVMVAANVNASPDDVAALFAQLDQNRDGKISLSEFLSGMKRLNKAVLMTGRLHAATQQKQPSQSNTSDKRLVELEERNAILVRYLRENFVEKCLRKADELLQARDVKGAVAMLELLDLPRVVKLEEFVGPVLPETATSSYDQLKLRVQATLHQPGKSG